MCLCVRVYHVWCRKHYREYLVSLINGHSLDPALLYDCEELVRACQRYQVEHQRADNEDDDAYRERLLKVRRPLIRQPSQVPSRTLGGYDFPEMMESSLLHE